MIEKNPDKAVICVIPFEKNSEYSQYQLMILHKDSEKKLTREQFNKIFLYANKKTHLDSSLHHFCLLSDGSALGSRKIFDKKFDGSLYKLYFFSEKSDDEMRKIMWDFVGLGNLTLSCKKLDSVIYRKAIKFCGFLKGDGYFAKLFFTDDYRKDIEKLQQLIGDKSGNPVFAFFSVSGFFSQYCIFYHYSGDVDLEYICNRINYLFHKLIKDGKDFKYISLGGGVYLMNKNIYEEIEKTPWADKYAICQLTIKSLEEASYLLLRAFNYYCQYFLVNKKILFLS